MERPETLWGIGESDYTGPWRPWALPLSEVGAIGEWRAEQCSVDLGFRIDWGTCTQSFVQSFIYQQTY